MTEQKKSLNKSICKPEKPEITPDQKPDLPEMPASDKPGVFFRESIPCQVDPSKPIIIRGEANPAAKHWTPMHIMELRKLYGIYLEADNLFMSIAHWLPMALQIQANITHYRGIRTSKMPLDSWIMQEIVYERRPDVIIEIGNLHGGSAVMHADCLFGAGGEKGLICIDIDHSKLDARAKKYPGIQWIEGDAKSDDVLKAAEDLISPKDRVMVIDDSNHTEDHTYAVLKKYQHLVTQDQYFIVEDTLIGHHIPRAHGEFGAMEAVLKFLKETKDFRSDRTREKWFITMNPRGYLERIS